MCSCCVLPVRPQSKAIIRCDLEQGRDYQTTDSLAASNRIHCKFSAGSLDHVSTVEMGVSDDPLGVIAHQHVTAAIVATMAKMKEDVFGERMKSVD
jgi:hypothetical protein